jgi:hypothetical protein
MKNQTQIEPEFVSQAQAAGFVCKSLSWFRAEEAAGRPLVPRYRVGTTPVYKLADLREYMASKLVKA